MEIEKIGRKIDESEKTFSLPKFLPFLQSAWLVWVCLHDDDGLASRDNREMYNNHKVAFLSMIRTSSVSQ